MSYRGFCQLCGKPLAGKQRKWCSEACRLRFVRSNGNERVQTGIERESSRFERELNGFKRESNGFAITIGVVIEYDHHGFDAAYDGWKIRSIIGPAIKKLVTEAMRAINHRWKYQITYLDVKHHRPQPYLWDKEE